MCRSSFLELLLSLRLDISIECAVCLSIYILFFAHFFDFVMMHRVVDATHRRHFPLFFLTAHLTLITAIEQHSPYDFGSSDICIEKLYRSFKGTSKNTLVLCLVQCSGLDRCPSEPKVYRRKTMAYLVNIVPHPSTNYDAEVKVP